MAGRLRKASSSRAPNRFQALQGSFHIDKLPSREYESRQPIGAQLATYFAVLGECVVACRPII